MRWGLAILLLACSTAEPSVAALAPPRLVEIAVEPSRGPDDPPRSIVAFQGAASPVDRPAISFVPRFGAGAAIVDPEHRLYEVSPDGRRRMLAAGASGSLAVSDDGRLLAYTIVRDLHGELRIHDGREERVIASALASIGVLRVLDDHVAFVGAAPGGIAGVWMAPLDGSGARCLSNCALRTGTDWRPRFVPPPSAAETFELGARALAWRDRDGTRHEVER